MARCVADGVAALVLGGEAYGEEPASKGDTAVPEADLIEAAVHLARAAERRRGITRRKRHQGERQMSSPDDGRIRPVATAIGAEAGCTFRPSRGSGRD
jgi:hypothetical protein